jgi:hypothetical protein
MLPRRCARFIKEARLREQDERPLGMLTASDGGFGLDDFLERAAHVDRRGPRAFGRPPRDGTVLRPIHLVHARAVAIPRESALVAAGKTRSSQAQELVRGHIKQDLPNCSELIDGVDDVSRHDGSAEGLETGRERVSDPLRPTAAKIIG